MPKDDFMDRVQAHERAWGEEIYPGRPTLNNIIAAPVAVFWRPVKRGKVGDRWIISLHANTKELEAWFLKAFSRIHITQPDRQFVAAYAQHKRIRIKGVRLIFATDEEAS